MQPKSLDEITLKDQNKITLKDMIWELYKFLLFVWTVSILWVVFINFNIFYSKFRQLFLEDIFASNGAISMSSFQDGAISNMANITKSWDFSWDNNIQQWDNFERLQEQKRREAIQNRLDQVQTVQKQNNEYEKNLESHLENKMIWYDFEFNTNPPDFRLTIDGVWIDAPVVTIDYASASKIDNADYDQELFEWVVQYPRTPRPGEEWNTMIFGHTSYYWWKDNPYGDVFVDMTKLNSWDIIEVYEDGQKYEYEVFDYSIVRPNRVGEQYEKYTDGGDYLTLMWCYPIGTNARRYLVFAKRV